MALLLHIDTATHVASACISHNGKLLAIQQNERQKEHATFINVAIKNICALTGVQLTQLDAVAVTHGPGSYTGLRVGLATAKGLCYALQKPLITLSTLQVMTAAAIALVQERKLPVEIFCPMIDARRMEVFTAIYDIHYNNIFPEKALVVEKGVFDNFMTLKPVLFFGDGSAKFSAIEDHQNAVFYHIQHDAAHLVTLAEQAFTKKAFADAAYAEPRYLKEFYHAAQ